MFRLRLIGLYLCGFGYITMLVALYMGNVSLLITEGFLTVTGAVLSLHQKKPQSSQIYVQAPQVSKEAADAMRKYHATHASKTMKETTNG